MKRRTFLASTAGASMLSTQCATRALQPGSTSHTEPHVQGEMGRIDPDLVRNRNQNRSTVLAQGGVVASSQWTATSVGLDILKQGGNAIDACIAMSSMLCVVEPASCGPGGDLFAIVWNESEQKLYGLNASGRSPYAWNRAEAARRGYENRLPGSGPLAWSVPGCVSGWKALQNKLGRLDEHAVLGPAAEYAYKGFPVTEIISGSFYNGADRFEGRPGGLQAFVPNGEEPRFGMVFRNPYIGDFFTILMRDGYDSFYKGEIADRIVAFSNEREGYFSHKDFEDHTATWVKPVSSSYRGYDVWEIPPNGQGIAALQMLNLLEQHDIADLAPNSAEQIHLFLEAKKLAFEDRALYYADMEKADVPVEWLISKDYATERGKRIDPRRAATDVGPGALDGSSDTIYCCAADGEGNMVSFIQSIYSGWGSREVPPGLGFCLQNRGTAFSLDPEHRNTLEPNKRPFHTIIPGFVTKDGKPKCAFGVMGGDFQPQGHAQVIMNMIDYGMSVQQAGEQPRARHYGSSGPTGSVMEDGGRVGLEAGIGEAVAEELRSMGHDVTQVDEGMHGGYQAIWRDDMPMRYFAGSDPRKDGGAIGY